jgi:predicted negative regulator of RcsB-dependent stress response
MATRHYDLEEQEQLAALKAWWHDNGTVVLSVVAAVALGVAGWQGWHWYQQREALRAGALYESLMQGARGDETKAVRDAAGALTAKFPRTLYATLGALTSARFFADHGDAKNAKAQLQWVVDHAASDDLRDLARLRLAALLLDEKAYDAALKLLEAPPLEAYAAQYAAARGDILQAKGAPSEAKTAYREALAKAAPQDDAWRAAIRLRLDALGG